MLHIQAFMLTPLNRGRLHLWVKNTFSFPVSFHLRSFVDLALLAVVVMSSHRRPSGSGAGRPTRSESCSSSVALARQPGSPSAVCSSSSQPQDDPPPAWAQQLMDQVAELKSASRDLQREVGDASDTDTEFASPAHRDQYTVNKRPLSVFRHIKANPSKAIGLAEKGEQLVSHCQTMIRIVDIDGRDIVRIFQKKPVVDTEAYTRHLKESQCKTFRHCCWHIH